MARLVIDGPVATGVPVPVSRKVRAPPKGTGPVAEDVLLSRREDES